MIHIPEQVKLILNILKENGFKAYIVGGCVRDCLLGKEPNDWDICTSALPNQTIDCFKDYRVIKTGISHGTVTIIMNHEPYEVTTYRVDGEYFDNRHPSQVRFVRNLKEDLSRRDFTFNAMAYSPKEGLVDCFHGEADLQNKQISCVGNPDERFVEDALRIMRALRFASVYEFIIDDSTDRSLHRHKALLNNIAVERINVELCKLLCGNGVEHILIDYHDIIGVFIPEIMPMAGFNQHNPYHCYDIWEHTVKSMMNTPKDIVLRLAMLFHDIGKTKCYVLDEKGIGHFYGHPQQSAEMCFEIMKRLKFDNNTINQVKELVLYHDADIQPRDKQIKRWLNKIGKERLCQLLLVKIADVSAQSDLMKQQRLTDLQEVILCMDKVIDQQQCFSLKDLAVNGKDLIEVGIPQGVQIGVVLSKLMDMVIDEQIENERGLLLKVARKIS